MLDEGQAALGAVGFAGLGHATKFAQGKTAGFGLRHAAADVVFDGHVDVRAKFLIEGCVEAARAKMAAMRLRKVRTLSMSDSYFDSARNSAMVAATRSQLRVSSAMRLLPVRVSE